MTKKNFFDITQSILVLEQNFILMALKNWQQKGLSCELYSFFDAVSLIL